EVSPGLPAAAAPLRRARPRSPAAPRDRYGRRPPGTAALALPPEPPRRRGAHHADRRPAATARETRPTAGNPSAPPGGGEGAARRQRRLRAPRRSEAALDLGVRHGPQPAAQVAGDRALPPLRMLPAGRRAQGHLLVGCVLPAHHPAAGRGHAPARRVLGV